MIDQDKPRMCKICGNRETKTGCGTCTCSNDHPDDPSNWTPIKPRICEVLGVEVGEKFSIDGYPTDYGVVQVCENGKIRRVVSTQEFPFAEKGEVGHKIGSNALYYLLNHPDRIIRKPRFTEEVACMRALREAGVKVVARDGDSMLYWYDCDVKWSGTQFVIEAVARCDFGRLPIRAFPSLRPGQSVALSEIVG